MTRTAVLIWGALAAAIIVPVVASLASPLLAWRSPIYIAAGLAGVLAMVLLLLQPVVMAEILPGVAGSRARRTHRWVGLGLISALVVHVAGLWITSPPDMIDALLFRSPTPFSAWGVIAMWAALLAAGFAVFRRRMPLRPLAWRRLHTSLAGVVVLGSIAHSMLIEGTMEILSKTALCALVLLATVIALIRLGIWPGRSDQSRRARR